MSKARSVQKEETFDASGSPDHQGSGFDLPLAMIVFNSEGRMLSSNPAMAGMLGYTSAEEMIRLAGDLAAKIIARSEDWEKILRLVQSRKKIRGLECKLLSANGSLLWVMLNADAVPDRGGGSICYRGCFIDITDRKKKELSLEEDRWRLQRIIEGAGIGTWEWNIQTGEARINDICARMLGYTLDELTPFTNNTWEKLVHPDDLKRSNELIELHLSGKSTHYECQCRMKHKNGHWIWALDRGRLASRTPDGGPLLMSGSHTEISSLKETEKKLKEREESLSNVLKDIPALLCRFTPEGIITHVNKEYCRYFNKTRDELISTNFLDLIPEEDREYVWQKFTSLTPDNPVITYEHRVTLPQGEINWQRWTDRCVFDEQGVPLVYQSIGIDITESRQLKESLMKSEEKYRALMEQSLDMIFVHDLEGNFLEVNRAAIKRTGYSREDLLGMGVFDLHPDQSGREEILEMWRKWRPGDSTILELTHVDKHGREYPAEINTGKVRFGNRDYILATVRDISQRKQALEDLKKSRLRFEYLLQSSARRNSFQNIIGRSKQMQHVYAMIHQVAGVDTTVLITGETGTGKELIVEALHAASPRKHGPLIKVNCLTLSEQLLDSELFGHVKGAFTGAYTDKIGRVEAAEGGTIFLDEIGDLTERIQLKLLRFLQEKEYERVGESKTRKADVRITAATNADLARRVEQGRFRKDLYYRLKVINIHVPPLKERNEDIPLLIEHFCRHFAEKFGKTIKGVKPEVMKLMLKHTWPGNVRELEHVLEHGTLLCPEGLIDIEHLPEELLDQEQTDPQLQLEAASVNREDLIKALEASRGKKTQAAKMLGISRRTLYRKMHKFGLFE